MPKADLSKGEIPLIDESCSKKAIEDIKGAIDTKFWIDERKYDECVFE